MRALLWCYLIVVCLTGPIQAQPLRTEAGRPFITNFTPADYNADTQNWALVEDDRGILYAGNNSGVLEYDGVTWRLTRLPNHTIVRSLSRDAGDRIWVGGQGELGYLAADSLGRTAFVSLRDRVPEAYRDFADVWETYATPKGVYFKTGNALFRWDGESMKVWPSPTLYHFSYVVDGVFYMRQWDVGLTRMETIGGDEALRLVPGGERFADTRVYVMLPYGDGRMLVGARDEGLFLYDGARFEPFRTEADGLLRRGQLYLPGVALSGGLFGLGTSSAGLAVIDRQGRLVQHIDRQIGLQDNSVNYPYQSPSGDLWLGLDNGLARVGIASPYTRFDALDGLETQAYWMTRHAGRLYAGTATSGLFVLDPATRAFRPIQSPFGQVYALLSAGGDLLVGGSNVGVHRVVGDRTEPVRPSVSDDYDVFALVPWSRDSTRVLVGLKDGLSVLRRRAGGWVDEGTVPGYDAWTIAEGADGAIWAGTQTGRLLRIRLPEPGDGPLDLRAAQVTVFTSADGLQEGYLLPYRVRDTIYVAGQGEAIFTYNEQTGRFTADSTFAGARSGHPLGLFILREDGEDRVWITSTYGPPVIAHRQDDGAYRFEILHAFHASRIVDVYAEPDGVFWLMGTDQLVRYDSRRSAPAATFHPPLVRRVTVGGELMYGGTGPAPDADLAYGAGPLRLAYAAPGGARYRTRLDGFDTHWSPWTTETEQTFTNLAPGDYTFRVEAEARGEAVYAFTVRPPWWRTLWAYTGYAFLLALGLFGVDRVQRRRLLARERAHAALREAHLRAEAAESQAQALQADNERKRNVELLSKIGQAITATLSVPEIIDRVYEHVNVLMDAAVFGIGLYNPAEDRIDFPATKENGETLPPYWNGLDEENRLSVRCFRRREEIVLGDFEREHGAYPNAYAAPVAGAVTASVLYLPLVQQDRVIGVITVQSFRRQAYSEHEVNLLRTLATYAAIALDNASAYRQLDATLGALRTTQQQLIQQEKLASLGQLTSGIAHEIKNPLNFVNNFAEINLELTNDLVDALNQGDAGEMRVLLDDLATNAHRIVKHGQRADEIVKTMMEHASGKSRERRQVEVNPFVEEYVNLAIRGKRGQTPELDVHIELDFDGASGRVDMAPRELGRVLINLVGNALDAVSEQAGSSDRAYRPQITVATRRAGDAVEIRVSDNGVGIPPAIRDKLFEPFFTTKPTGKGMGLGLSLSYDIVTLGHGGTLTVESEAGQGATFVVSLPLSGGGHSDPHPR